MNKFEKENEKKFKLFDESVKTEQIIDDYLQNLKKGKTEPAQAYSEQQTNEI